MASINKKKLADSVIEEIKRMLTNGELKEGEKLPNQNELATMLGVSRTSLREALNSLTMIGVIEQRPGFGTVIRSRGPAIFADHLSFPLISDEQATIELIEARGVIEIGAVELAVRHAAPEQVEEMGRLIEIMAQDVREKRISDYIENDVAFHYLIAKASQNRFILHLFATLRGAMEQYMQEAFKVLPWMQDRSFEFHQKIYEGIKNRDVSKAVSQMKKHIQDIQGVIEQYYASLPSGSGKKATEENMKDHVRG
jgi:GntR family transcriptional repressor for pyruvate dehydrogenase complex